MLGGVGTYRKSHCAPTISDTVISDSFTVLDRPCTVNNQPKNNIPKKFRNTIFNELRQNLEKKNGFGNLKNTPKSIFGVLGWILDTREIVYRQNDGVNTLRG